MGISTIFLPEKFVTDTFSKDEIVNEIHKLMDQKSLKLYGLLTHYEDEHHKTKRQCIFYSKDQELLQKFALYLHNIKELKLEESKSTDFNNENVFYFWNNGNASYSRKKLEPFFK